jgi:hypothetical protein
MEKRNAPIPNIRTARSTIQRLLESGLGKIELLAEPVDAAGGVYEALLTRVERVASGADVHVKVFLLGGPGLDDGAACAMHRNCVVVGMNFWLHGKELQVNGGGNVVRTCPKFKARFH